MTSIRESIRRLFITVEPLPPGTYHYQAPASDPENYRLHLRLEPDGTGILIVNAHTVLHLNQTAAECAFYLVQNLPEDQAAANLARRYRVSKRQALVDYRDFEDRVRTLISTPDLDPVTYLDFDRTAPYSKDISAPYRLDCALTYRLPPEAPVSAAPEERVKRELSTGEWEAIIDKAWEAGIPQIIFTGGEPTLRDDLLDLIRKAESNGQVSGLMTDGLRLLENGLLDNLLQTGLDHLTLIFHPEVERSWQVLEKLMAADLFVVVHLTITPEDVDQIEGLLNRLAEAGVKAVSLSITDPDLAPELHEARNQAAHLQLALVWDLPVPYTALNPVALETRGVNGEGVETRPGAGRAWLYVEPDGDVLASQGVLDVLGNMLTDPWSVIWQKARQKTQS